MSDQTIVTIIVRIMPQAEDLEIELPLYTTGKQIVEELLSQQIIPRNDEAGNPIVYELVSKKVGKKLMPEDRLADLNVPNGDTLLLTHKAYTGASKLNA
jgi:uncharacterized ubiquitin-like protein YukD